MNYQSNFKIFNKEISITSPTYFIADIAANHDGDIERAKELIVKAKESGADCAKFQHFKADKIVSDKGFRTLGASASHQEKWKDSVYNVFKKYEFPSEWTKELKEFCDKMEIHFMSTPYDYDSIDILDRYVTAYKIGSGDITWIDEIEHISKKNKPVLLAAGASTIEDVKRAVNAIIKHNKQIVLMQCNTNYTGSIDNFTNINLNVLKTFSTIWPSMPLGLSDHTPGHTTVLGAVTLGARVIEKHFTDSNEREGPDHAFSMTPTTWYEMVQRTRELELALGDGVKRIEENETETVVLQRRCVRLNKEMKMGDIISTDDLEILRPSPAGALQPYEMSHAIGKRLIVNKTAGDAINYTDFE